MKVIPEGWKDCLFNDLIEKILDNRGKTPPIEKIRTDYPLLEVNAVSEFMKSPNYAKVTKYVTKKIYNEWFRAGHPQIGDILMPTVGTLGNAAVMTQNKGSIAQNIIAVKIKAEHDSFFLYYVVTSPFFRNQIEKVQMNSAQPSLKVPYMKKFNVLIPPLPEQQKIAIILSTVDEKIDLIDQQIAETTLLKKGLMQRLLTKGIGHTEFKDSPLGKIPKSWEVEKIGKVVSVKVGRDLQEDKYSEIQDGDFQYPVFSNTVANYGLYGYYNFKEYEGESITVVGRGVGVGTAFPRNGAYGAIGRLLVLFPNQSISYIFLSYHIDFSIKFFSENSAIPQLTGAQIIKYYIKVPPLPEQIKIANILSSVDEKLNVLSDKKTHYQELKQGLMQQLLTGKIRVNKLINKPTMA